jgi:parvulin-like peptidyl-prolyl isomerase
VARAAWLLALLAACGAGPGGPQGEPDHVLVDHILIGVRHRRLPHVKRNSTAAREIAFRVYHELREGGDFEQLKQKYSDDRGNKGAGGPYWIANDGVAPRRELKEQARQKAVRAFGDTAFSLDVGETVVVEYHPVASPFGFHILRRLE